ncbi:MAG: creatininase family protein [candidate division Zixibacteria bacterium]|nr:creatininase family protein [candidate division Zixibacteria bacterium]
MAWYRLEEMTWQKVAEVVPAQCDLIFLPVGTIEAHGSAALGTDNLIPIAIAEYLAERFNAICAPCVHYGITKSLYGYPGSITIKPEHFHNYLFDILASLGHKKFDRVIIINGHGGNNEVLKAVAHDANVQFNIKVAVLHWWQLCADVTAEVYGGPGGHAGCDETGFVMSINPAYGDKESYDPGLAYRFTSGADVYPIPGSVLLYDDEGRGEPDFDVEKGKELAAKVKARIGDYLEDVFARWKRFFPPS